MNKKPITFIILYLIVGLFYQIYICVSNPLGQDGMPPDIPACSFPWAIFPWGIIVILGWPFFGIFDLFQGFIVRGIINLVLLALTIIIPKTLFRKNQ